MLFRGRCRFFRLSANYLILNRYPPVKTPFLPSDELYMKFLPYRSAKFVQNYYRTSMQPTPQPDLKNRFRRRLIRQQEGKVSVLQLIGFCLVGFGVLCWLIGLIWPKDFLSGERIAMIFFITMLGMS